jgi:hypothetical protein
MQTDERSHVLYESRNEGHALIKLMAGNEKKRKSWE